MPPPDDAGPSLPYRQASKLLTHFATFLTLALHTLLYHRSLYPEPTFLTARAYNLPVRQSRHPGVCRWVTDAVAAVVAQLRTAAVERVVFSVHEKSVAVPAAPAAAPAPTSAFAVKGGAPKKDAAKREKGAQKTFAVLERWIFDVSSFPSWPGEEDDPTKETGYDSDENEDGDRDEHELGDEEEEDEGEENLIDEDEVDEDAIIWNDVNESLRGALGRLAAAAEGMPPLPEGCPFTLAIELRGEAKPPIEVSYSRTFYADDDAGGLRGSSIRRRGFHLNRHSSNSRANKGSSLPNEPAQHLSELSKPAPFSSNAGSNRATQPRKQGLRPFSYHETLEGLRQHLHKYTSRRYVVK